MDDPRAQRTLVKSPPELWAEVSDAGALARHLGAFGEIRITRLEPETTVAWEGERARGTVELEPSGWGTRVTLIARLEPETAAEGVPGPVAAPAPDEFGPEVTPPEPVVEKPPAEERRGRAAARAREGSGREATPPERVVEKPPAEEPMGEEPAAAEPPVEEPPAEEPAPAEAPVEEQPAPEQEPARRRGFFAR